MNQTRSRQPLLCSSARGGDHRRKPPPLPCCTVDGHHVPRTRSWADAATSTQLDTIPAHARAKGVSALPKISNLRGKDNPRFVTGSYQSVSAPVGAATWGHPGTMMLARAAYAGVRTTLAGLPGLRTAVRAGGLTELLERLGGLVFAGNDREARWRGWSIERRHAGLSRVYRDPIFDRLVRCPHCRGGPDPRAVPCAHHAQGAAACSSISRRSHTTGRASWQGDALASERSEGARQRRNAMRPVSHPNPIVVAWRWRSDSRAHVVIVDVIRRRPASPPGPEAGP